MRHRLISIVIAMLSVAGCKPAIPEKAAPAPAPVVNPASAVAAAPAATPAVAVACAADETPIYACDFGAKQVAVCSTGTTVTYRYGPAAKAELVLARTVGQPGLVQDGIRGGGGGSQTSLTFSQGEYDYTVYSAAYGELTEVAGQTSSGLAVQKGHEEPVAQVCPQKTEAQAISTLNIPPEVPSQTDETKSMWF
jgi:hypothetical protein